MREPDGDIGPPSSGGLFHAERKDRSNGETECQGGHRHHHVFSIWRSLKTLSHRTSANGDWVDATTVWIFHRTAPPPSPPTSVGEASAQVPNPAFPTDRARQPPAPGQKAPGTYLR